MAFPIEFDGTDSEGGNLVNAESLIMPSQISIFCVMLVEHSPFHSGCRHNQRELRKAKVLSLGLYRLPRDPGELTLASARSFIFRSA